MPTDGPLVTVDKARRTTPGNAQGWGEWECFPACGHPPVLRVGQVPPKRIRCRSCR